MNSREIIRLLEADGWTFKSQEGSHRHFKHPTKLGKTTVPHPARDINVKTVRSIERQSGVNLRRR